MNKEIMGKLENFDVISTSNEEYNTRCLYSSIYNYFIECYRGDKIIGFKSEYYALQGMIISRVLKNNDYVKIICDGFSGLVNYKWLFNELQNDGFSIDFLDNAKGVFEIGITEEKFEKMINEVHKEKTKKL